MNMNEDKLYRALAMHAALTTTIWADMPLKERLVFLEDKIRGHALSEFADVLATHPGEGQQSPALAR